MTDLLSCPFCGVAHTDISNRYTDHYQVHCMHCGADGPSGARVEIAAAAWNTRATLTQPAGDVVEALRAVEAAMLRGGDGQIGDFGWNITKLNEARPLIRAALSSTPVASGEVGLLDQIAEMMSAHVENWPNPKKVSTAISLIDKTLTAAVEDNRRLLDAIDNPPRHRYWGAGEADCPRDIKAGNGELHTLRCKVCGNEDARNQICRAAVLAETNFSSPVATSTPDPVGKIVAWLRKQADLGTDAAMSAAINSDSERNFVAGAVALKRAADAIERGDWRDTPSAARDELAAEAQEMGLYPSPSDQVWRDIESAPVNTPVRVKAGSMTFLARLVPNGSMTTEEQMCDQWQAEIEGEHPPCWSGGGCWESNEDEISSLQPTHWMPADPRSPAGSVE